MSSVIEDMNNILGRPYVDFTSIYRFGDKHPYGYVCIEKATGTKYTCRLLRKHRISSTGTVRRYVEICQHMSQKQQYYANNNILEFKAAYEDADTVYLVMELCSNNRLDYWIRAKERELDEEEAAFLFWQVLNAVNAFHSMGVMIRSLNTANFWFQHEDKEELRIKAMINTDAVFIDQGTLHDGRPDRPMAYQDAPETKNQNYVKETDVWATGAILYRLLTRRFLHPEAIDQDELDEWINEELSDKSDAAEDLLKKLLKLDYKQRITVAEALEHPWVDDSFYNTMMRRFSSTVEVLAKTLSEEENQRLKQLLNNIDTYGSTMTLEELIIGLSPLSSTLSESRMKELNDAVKEFFTSPSVAKIMRRHRLENENIHKAFLFFDKDGDRFITRDDLGQVMGSYHITGEAAIDEIIDDVDTDKDGKIDYGEFQVMIKKEMHDFNENQRKIKF